MIRPILLACALAASFSTVPLRAGVPKPIVGGVYTMDNAPDGNHLWAYGRRIDGKLTDPWVVPTGGLGTGGGLGNQGSVLLAPNGRWLFVCNAGSDDISVFSTTAVGVRLTDRAHSGGRHPVSLALHGDLLYVLNAGGSEPDGQDQISGFVFRRGRLFALPNSAAALSADNTAPAQIAFTDDGRTLVVTEKSTGLIDTFSLGRDGRIDGHHSYSSPAPPPFGFAAGRNDRIFVTEANGGAGNPGGGSVSSYQLDADGALVPLSVSVPTHLTAACWIVLTGSERFAFVANTPSDSISSFMVSRHGELELLDSQAAFIGMGSAPVDMALSTRDEYLYTLNSGAGSITALRVNGRTGELQEIGTVGGLPLTINGLAAQ